MEVELTTKAEANYFLKPSAQQLNNLRDIFFQIGGSYIDDGMNEFYWMTRRKRVNYSLNYAPGQLDNTGASENCLSIKK